MSDLIPSDLTKVRNDADVPFECAVCWNLTPHYVRKGKPRYEGLSKPSMIFVRFCDRHDDLSCEEAHRLADVWLDAQIEAGRAKVGTPQRWAKPAGEGGAS